jgi:hypothetical protein
LEASAKLAGPDFHALFEVPVLAVTETQPAKVAGSDPTLSYQMTLDEVRKEIHSRIQVVEQGDGREFIFPAGRNPGFASIVAALWLIWTVAVIVMVCWHAPLLFPLIFAVIDVLMSIFMFDLWLRRNRVLVTPAQIKIQTNWLAYKKETVLAVAEVANLKADVGATAGHAVYYDLKIRTRDGRDFLAAKYLSHKPEADWLIRQMAAPLKRSAD